MFGFLCNPNVACCVLAIVYFLEAVTLSEERLESILSYQISSHFRWMWMIDNIKNNTHNIYENQKGIHAFFPVIVSL